MRRRTIAALAAVAMLSACASSTRLITNDKPSEAVKAKGYGSYHEVLFIPPKDDPRQIVPRVVHDIEKLGFTVRVMDPGKPIDAPQGTGFVIGADGLLLTCAHVTGESTTATVTLGGQRLTADVVKADAKADLALLRLRTPLPEGTPVLRFREATRPPVLGEEVSTLGYPLSRLLGNSVRMSRGLVSATAGIHDNDQQLQVSAEIQPGSSGGPLLDQKGNVIGVIASSLNPAAVAQATGSLPQNINFAVKTQPVLDFLRDADASVRDGLRFEPAGGVAGAEKAVAKVQAGIVAPDVDRRDKMVVRLSYQSFWDVWYRFRYFVLAAFDYDTQEPLFVAGQGRDNVISNEDIVIRDSVAQFAKAVTAR
ncbi:MAG TPA: serine protease [Caldimonas sp.]|nr:serine protease [Caldimonas sp.]